MQAFRGLLVAAALATAAVGLAGASSAAPVEAGGPTITVSGEGRVSRAPDMAEMRLSVTALAPTAAAALAQASGQLAGVLKRLAAEGVAEADLQTTGLSLAPRWDTPPAGSGQVAKIAGFEAASTLTVKLRALDKLGGLLDAVVKDGANGFSGLSFGLADPAAAEDAARRAAVADAMHKAALYAAAAGVKLGPLEAIRDGGESRPVPMLRAAPMAMAAVPVAQGELEITAQVTLVFAIAE